MDKFETQPDGTITQADPLDSGDPIHIIDLIMFRLRDFLDEYEFAEIEGFAKRAIRSENIDRLRAEVSSLKEERENLRDAAAHLRSERDRYQEQFNDESELNAKLTQQLAAANGRVEMLRDALTGLLNYALRFVCYHDETHRGGAIWEICDLCGKKWADDEGGKPEFKEPKEISKANAALSNLNEDSAG